MIETATVKKIDGDVVTVEASLERCEACTSSFCAVKSRVFTAKNGDNRELRVGDRVEVYASPGRAAGAAVVVFLIPLAGFVVAYLLAQAAGLPGQGLPALVGFAGLAAGSGITLLVSRSRRAADMPSIAGVIDPSAPDRSDRSGRSGQLPAV